MKRMRWTRAAIALLMGVLVTTSPAGAEPESSTPGLKVRKNVKELTPQERKTFIDAMLALKQTPSPFDSTGKLSYYDQLTEWHKQLLRCSPLYHDPLSGHTGPMFLPWHRAYLLVLENALSDVAGTPIAVPYWDWSDPSSTASVFADDFMGGDGNPNEGYAVTTGPFRKGRWTLTVKPEGVLWATSARPYLTRKFGSGSGLVLPDVRDVAWALSVQRYDVGPYDSSSDPNESFRNAIEGFWSTSSNGTRQRDVAGRGHRCDPTGWWMPLRDAGKMHSAIHATVAGLVADTRDEPQVFGTLTTTPSPNDPVFYLNHANVDRLWSKWQDLHGIPFEPVDLANTAMQPFKSAGLGTFTPASVERTEQLGYVYSDYQDSDDALVPAPATPAPRRPAVAPSASGWWAAFRCRIPRVF